MSIYHTPFADVPLRDQSITERVFEGLEGRPDDVVLIDGPTGRSLTAADFMDRVKRLAGGLTAAGLGQGKVVALMAPQYARLLRDLSCRRLGRWHDHDAEPDLYRDRNPPSAGGFAC